MDPRPTGRSSHASSSGTGTGWSWSRWATASRPSAVRGRRRLAGVTVSVRYTRVAAVAAQQGARADSSTRPPRMRPRASPPGVADAARGRSWSPTPPTSGHGATASSTGRSRSSSARARRRVEALKRARTLGWAGRARSSCPSAYLARSPVAGDSTSAGCRYCQTRRPRSTSRPEEPGTFVFVGRLTRQKDLDIAIGARRGPRGAADRRGRRARPRAAGSGGASRGSTGGSRSAASCRAMRRSRSLPGADAASSPAPGRTSRTLSSRRSRSASPSSRLPSGACRRSCTTARTGCSCRPVTSTRSRRRSSRMLEEPDFGNSWPPARGLRWRACRPTPSTASWSRFSARSLVPEEKPRVLFVGRGRYMLPLSDAQETKWRALEKVIDYRVLGSAERGSTGSTERFRLRAHPSRAAQWRALPSAAPFSHRAPDHRIRTDAIMWRSVHLCRCARRTTSCETGDAGDRRGARRLAHVYQVATDRQRGLLPTPLTARICASCSAVPTRPERSPSFTSGLIEEVRGEPATMAFPAYSDLSAFVERPVKPLRKVPWPSSSACLRRIRTSTVSLRPGAASSRRCRRRGS